LGTNYPDVSKETWKVVDWATCSIRIHKNKIEKDELFLHELVLTILWILLLKPVTATKGYVD